MVNRWKIYCCLVVFDASSFNREIAIRWIDFFFSLFLPIFNLFLQPRILVNGHGKSLTGRMIRVVHDSKYIYREGFEIRCFVHCWGNHREEDSQKKGWTRSRSFHFFRVISHNITHSKESYSSQKASPSVFNLATAIISRIITRPTERNRAGFKSAQKGVKAGVKPHQDRDIDQSCINLARLSFVNELCPVCYSVVHDGTKDSFDCSIVHPESTSRESPMK